MRVVGRHGTCQGAYMVLAVPVVITGEQKFFHGIIVLDEIGFQEISDVLDADVDTCQLHFERQTLLYSRFHGLKSNPFLVLRYIFGIFHHHVVSQFILLVQIFHHLLDVLFRAFHAFFLLVCRSVFSLRYGWSCFLMHQFLVYFQGDSLRIIIRQGIERKEEIASYRRLLAGYLGMDDRLVDGQDMSVGTLVESVGMFFICRQFTLFIGEFYQYFHASAIGSGHGDKGGGEEGSLFLHELNVFRFQYISER